MELALTRNQDAARVYAAVERLIAGVLAKMSDFGPAEVSGQG